MQPVIFWQGLNLMQLAQRIKMEWDECEVDDRPASICIDSIGVGGGLVDALTEMANAGQFGETLIIGVNVSESAAVTDKFARLRDELWWKARSWFEKLDCSMEYDVERRSSWILEGNEEVLSSPFEPIIRKAPITDELRDILFSYLPNGKIKLEPKQDTKERLGRSPDAADAFVLTFADQDVTLDHILGRPPRYQRRHSRQGSSWAA